MSPRGTTSIVGALLLGALAACSSTAATPAPTAPVATAPPGPPTTGCPATAPELAEDGVEVEGSPLGLSIERLCVYGADDETKAMVEKSLTLKVGQPLSAEATRASLEQVTRLELFEDVRLGAEKHSDAAIVHVVVVARPRIESVVFEPETSKRLVDLGHHADPRRLRAAAAQMEDELHQEGRGNAKVTMSIEPVKPGAARVRVKVDAGAVWTIAKLSFPGAKKIPEADLRAATEIPTGSFWNGERITIAGLRIASFYFDRGYLTVKVADPAQSVDASGNVSLSWTIDEGAAYTLGKVTFKGALAARMQGDLRKAMTSRTGATFSRSVFAADLARMKELLAQRGHKVDVTPITDLDQKKHSVAITLEIGEPEGAH